MKSKKIVNEEISVKYRGRKYQGTVIIEGARKLYQTITHGIRSKRDDRSYQTDQREEMRNAAKSILTELVSDEMKVSRRSGK